MVHRRPRYIVGWMPRVYGGSPGAPGSAPSASKIGGSGAPYVVSNFARSATRLVASAYFVRSHSARLRLFFGTFGWYAAVESRNGREDPDRSGRPLGRACLRSI